MGKIKIYLINLYILFSYIDDVLLTMRAKNASEILDDAIGLVRNFLRFF